MVFEMSYLFDDRREPRSAARQLSAGQDLTRQPFTFPMDHDKMLSTKSSRFLQVMDKIADACHGQDDLGCHFHAKRDADEE